MNRLPVEPNRPGVERISAKDAACHLGPTASHQTEHPQDLAPPQRERDVRKGSFLGQVPHLQSSLHSGRSSDGEDLPQGPPNHHLDQLVLIGLLRFDGADQLAVLEHRDPIRDLEHLIQAVRDVQDQRPILLELAHQREQAVQLLLGEDGRRLVQDQDSPPLGHSLGDLDHLLVRDAQLPDDLVHVDPHETD